jgi:hypothetical protein
MATKFIPFWNPEHYFADLLKSGASLEDVARLRKLHDDNPIKKIPIIKKPKPELTIEEALKKYSCDPWKKPTATERMKSRVSKFPHINTQPLADLYAKYSNPLRKPPLEERIKVMHQCGYPEEVLMETMKREERMIAQSDEMDAFIYAIFGEANEKKQSAPKKRTITQILKIKKMSYARPDVEDPAVDDPVSDFEDAAPEED